MYLILTAVRDSLSDAMVTPKTSQPLRFHPPLLDSKCAVGWKTK